MGETSTLQIARWKVAVDVQGTRAIYAQSTAGADACGCSACQSYASVRHIAIPREARHVLDSLGIDPMKEEEVFGGYPDGTNSRRFEGWFHFLGEVLEGNSQGIVNVTPGFSFYLAAGPGGPAFERFKGKRTGVFEFAARIPDETPGFRPFGDEDAAEADARGAPRGLEKLPRRHRVNG